MMYRAKVEAINGLNVKANGKWLTIIGNKPVSIGDDIWTDGRCVYGNYQYHAQPFAVVPNDEEICVLLIGGVSVKKATTWVYSLRSNTSYIKAQKEKRQSKQLNIAASDIDYYLTCSIKKPILIGTSARYEQKFRSLQDAIVKVNTDNGNNDVYQVFLDIDNWNSNNIRMYKNNEPIYTLSASLNSSWLPAYFYGDENVSEIPNHAKRFYIEGVYSPCVDFDGKFYCIAAVSEQYGSDYVVHSKIEFFYVQNSSFTLLRNWASTTTWTPVAGLEDFFPEIGEYVREDDENVDNLKLSPHSFYLPLKNNGRGGYYSLNMSIEPNREWVYKIDFTEVCFYDSKFNLLFALTKDDISAAGVDFDPEAEVILPHFDICKISSGAYLILILDNEGYRRILKYVQGELLMVNVSDDEIFVTDRMFALPTVKKERLSSTINRFLEGIDKKLSFIEG